MDKAKLFIEKHIQWLVLVIALLYVGYTVFTYVWKAPLTVNLGRLKDVKPADIDPTINSTQIAPLLKDIENRVVSAAESHRRPDRF